MFRPRVIPVLLLKNKGLVKTINFKKTRYIGDPINAVKIFNDLKADELMFLDIESSIRDKSIMFDLIRKISEEAFMPFSVGGGIKNIDDAAKIIEQGAEKIVLNSHVFYNPELIRIIADHFGSQSVCVSIDVKKNLFGNYQILSLSGTKKIKFKIIDWVTKIIDLGAGEILINSVDNDGRMNGYDLKIIETISSVSNVPVVACGGAGKLNDFKLAVESGAHAVAAGSMFIYHGPRKGVLINYPNKNELLEIFNEK